MAMEDGTREVEAGYRRDRSRPAKTCTTSATSRRSPPSSPRPSRSHRSSRCARSESAAAAVQSIAGVRVQTEQGVLETRKSMDQLVRLSEDLMANLARFKLSAQG